MQARGTRIYVIAMAAVSIAVIGVWLLSWIERYSTPRRVRRFFSAETPSAEGFLREVHPENGQTLLIHTFIGANPIYSDPVPVVFVIMNTAGTRMSDEDVSNFTAKIVSGRYVVNLEVVGWRSWNSQASEYLVMRGVSNKHIDELIPNVTTSPVELVASFTFNRLEYSLQIPNIDVSINETRWHSSSEARMAYAEVSGMALLALLAVLVLMRQFLGHKATSQRPAEDVGG